MASMEAVMLRTALGPSTKMPQSVQRLQIVSSFLPQKKRVQRVQISSSQKPCGIHLAAAAVAREAVHDVTLESEVGVSYEALRDKLSSGEWEAADAETRRLLCVLAGEGAVKRKWVYFSEVQFIPEADLKTIDGLWRAHSDNKFGYSVQRRIWKNVNESWTRFFSKVSWTKPMADSRNNAYKKFPLEFMWDVAEPTPLGHLPLTNALRGTQLLEKLLSHPAFDFADDEGTLILPDTESFLQSPSPLSPSQPQLSSQQSENQQRRVISDADMTVDYGF